MKINLNKIGQELLFEIDKDIYKNCFRKGIKKNLRSNPRHKVEKYGDYSFNVNGFNDYMTDCINNYLKNVKK